jgi:nitrogen-specific signal transduction histidine kinase/DNA-binding response OmpR family regulator
MSERILVVDDEPGVVAACVRALSRVGYVVEGVEDGEAALNRLEEEGFDLLLTDLRMPGRDGLELMALAKELDPHLSVVMITGYGTMDDALRAIGLGAQGFLLKPFDPGELVDVVQDSLRRRALLRDSLRLQTLLPLLEINQALRDADGASSLTQQVLDVALRETGASRLWLVMRDPSSNELVTVTSAGQNGERGALPPSAVEQVFETGESVWVDVDGQLHRESAETRRVFGLSRPLLMKDQVVGVLSAEKVHGSPPFSQIGLELLSLLSGQLAIAIENVELYHQQQTLRSFNEDIIQTMTNGLVVVNELGQVTVLNKAAAILLGYDASEVLEKPLRDVIPTADSLADIVEAALRLSDQLPLSEEENGRQLDYISPLSLQYPVGEVTVSHRDGTPLPLAVSASALRDRSGKVTGVVCLFEDLSETKALEAERRRLDRLAALGEMSAVVAHEIRNPMAGIAAGVQYLSKSIPDGSAQREGVTMILGEIQRVNRILEDILSVARPSQLMLGEQSLADIVDGVLRRAEPTIEAKSIQVERQYAPHLPIVQADRERLEQALTNLIFNAVEAIPGGKPGVLTIGLEADDDWLTITITDTGPGISEETQQRIFEPFFTTKAQGTGLGLAIARRAVEDHGGSIWVASEPGKGTTFSIQLSLDTPVPVEEAF